MPNFNITVNGKIYAVDVKDKSKKLLDWLRNNAKLTGTKCGCGVGQCGSCIVLVDGKATRSCLVKMEKLENRNILTIEGLATKNGLHPVQESFIKFGAVQCGFCTPGMIMSAVALLQENVNPSRQDIEKALKINYCRCGTYPRVFEAIGYAAKIMRGELSLIEIDKKDEIQKWQDPLGLSVKGSDFINKVTGNLKFIDDLTFDGLIYGKILWSEHPYAEIIDIDTEEARNVEGVELVLTHKDIPGENRFGVLEKDQPVLAENQVRYIGEPIAVVFAETEALAESAVNKIKVTYNKKEGIFSVQRALEDDAPKLHEKGNIIKQVNLRKGDIENAFKSADVIIEGDYYTPWIEHAWIETESSLAKPNERGGVDVYAANQSPFADRKQLATILGLAEDKVRVIHLPAGGAFGGKTELTVHPFVALAAMITNRPAKITLSRAESLRFHPKRHAYFMHYRTAATADGKLVGMDINLLADGGAYASWSPRVIEQSVAFGTGPYYIPNLRINGKAVYTNNMVSGAMRGFGANQVHFAVESQMDKLAEKLSIDPIEIRQINALKENMEMSTGQLITSGHAYDKTLDVIKSKVKDYLSHMKKEEGVGIGIASAWRSVAGGLGPDEGSGATLLLQPNGRLLLKIACTEMGQGSQTGLAQIVSHVLNVPLTNIDILAGDTMNVPEAGGVMASRGLYLWGHAVEAVSKEMKDLLLREASRITGISVQNLKLSNGFFIDKTNDVNVLSLYELAEKASLTLEAEKYIQLPKSYPIMEDANASRSIPPNEFKTHHTIAYNTTAVVVKVDYRSKEIQVLKVIIAVDAGRVFNPDAAKRQIEGAIIMGMGATLDEEFIIKEGWNVTDSFRKCKIPNISKIPTDIEIHFVDSLDPTGPMGAKGVGEIGILAIAPAITNAIHDATGKRFSRLPVKL